MTLGGRVCDTLRGVTTDGVMRDGGPKVIDWCAYRSTFYRGLCGVSEVAVALLHDQ